MEQRTWTRRWCGALVSAAVAGLALVGGSERPFDPMPIVRAAQFDPVPSTSLGTPSAFGRVATDGQGTFHSVVRSDQPVQRIVYRRSRDGGEQWTTVANWTGDNGGATRPWIAVDGERVAVTYLGSWCGSATLCHEAPYLVQSHDGGATWSSPRRVDTQAFNVRVAVDDNRTWVAWERGGSVQLRGYVGNTQFAERTLPYGIPHLAAADGAMILGIETFAGVTVSTAHLQQINNAVELAGESSNLANWENSVAAADGRVHALVESGADGERSLAVTSSGTSGLFGPLREVGTPGTGAAITATRGTVAVAMAAKDGTTEVVTSSDVGATFSEPVVVSAVRPGEALVEIGSSRIPDDVPIARFDWSVPERYVDRTGDGIADPAFDTVTVAEGANVTVSVDACASLPDVGATIVQYIWAVDGDPVDVTDGCRTSFTVPNGEPVEVRLITETSSGTQASVVQMVTARDLLVVSIGDSVASGEGNPLPGDGWHDASCHRSGLAGPALAARQLEQADPRSSVTFVHLACSGAAVVDTAGMPGVDDPGTGGIVDGYAGIAPTGGVVHPPQIEQMASLVAGREVDALLVSTGANDVRFSDVIMGCLATLGCQSGPVAQDFAARAASLPERYGLLASALIDAGVLPERVHLSEYFDPTTPGTGVPDLRCVGMAELNDLAVASVVAPAVVAFLAEFNALLPFGVLFSQPEAQWAHDTVVARLNAEVAAAASARQWNHVAGVGAAFVGHGYCASDPWVVGLRDSFLGQGDKNGAFHPNAVGHRVIGQSLFESMRASLLVDEPTDEPEAAAGPDSIADLMVMTTTRDEVVVAPVGTTGGAPEPRGSRRLDRVAAGNGYFGPAGPPAVDRAVAVGAWWEVDNEGGALPSVYLARLGVRPNVAVRQVDIVQAPADAGRIVADRPTLVRAVLDASVAEPTTIDVATVVEEFDDFGVASPRLDEVETVTVNPGRNVVLLPRTVTFEADDGATLRARVEVTDPLGAIAADAFDDVGHSDEVVASTTRPLKLLVGSVRPQVGGVSCDDARGAAERFVAYVRHAMPVDAVGVEAEFYCNLDVAYQPTEVGLVDLMLEVEDLAYYTGSDAVVVVVPDRTLRDAAKGAVGIAAGGLRAVVVEQTAPPFTLAHELAHTLGLSHTDGLVATEGTLVSRRLDRAGVDWMAERAQPKSWTGAATWDRLVTRIGGPSRAPAPIDPNGPGLWVRGSVTADDAGNAVFNRGQWIPAASAPSGPPVEPGDVDLERLELIQLDASGDLIGAGEALGLSDVEGLFATDSDPGPLNGATVGQFVSLDPDATALQIVLDDEIVEEVPLGGAPMITLTDPTAGPQVPRGGTFEVAWTAGDPDGDDLTFDLMISDDDGVTWQPLASDVPGSPYSATLPADVGGDAVRVQVVATDGARFAAATSDRFSAEPPAVSRERVVLVRSDASLHAGGLERLYTINPDGSDFALVPLPVTSPPDVCPFGCPSYPFHPAWSPDGNEIAFTFNYVEAVDDGQSPSGNERRIFTVRPDGTDLTPVTPLTSDPWWFGGSGWFSAPVDNWCPSWSPDGQAVTWLGRNVSAVTTVWVSRRGAGGWETPVAVFESGPQDALTINDTFPIPVTNPTASITPTPGITQPCPVWSPDGTRVAFVAELTMRAAAEPDAVVRQYAESAAYVVDADGSDLRVVSPRSPYFPLQGAYSNFRVDAESVDGLLWSDDSTLTITRGSVVMGEWNLTVGLIPTQTVWGLFDLDIDRASLTRITPLPDTQPPARPRVWKESPSGVLYGEQSGLGSVSSGWSLVTLDPSTGATEPTMVPPLPGGWPSSSRQYDWGIERPVPQVPLVPFDPDDAPPPGDDPVEFDVGEVTPPGPPASGADDRGPDEIGSPQPFGPLTLVAGTTTVVDLPISGPLTTRLLLDTPPTGDLELSADGTTLRITVPPGRVGATWFSFAVAANPEVQRVDVQIDPPPAPMLGDDTVVIGANTASIGPAQLLENDDGGLTLVGIDGPDHLAWLDAEGTIRLAAELTQPLQFRYLAVTPLGAVGSATVSLVFEQVPPSTTAPPTTAPASTAPATIVPASTVANTGIPVGGLPATGSSPHRVFVVAAIAVGGGALLLALSAVGRRRRACDARR